MRQHLPIVYFFGIEPGRYLPLFPAFVVADDPASKSVTLEVRSAAIAQSGLVGSEPVEDALRRYAVVAVRRRLHQARFRSVVLHAYRCRCAVCSLTKAPLLDAAHIIEDGDVAGIAAVRNGLALCKIHHAAYDGNLLGIDPGLRVHIARELLDETDGPMLQHGLKDMHGRTLVSLPTRATDRPDPDRLERRFAEFRLAQ